MRALKKMKLYEFVTTPISFLGLLFHYTLEAPFYIGRQKANASLHRIRRQHAEDLKNGND